ncbi:hypothetical protein Tco_1352956, partial [Tanacetum coccineum]
SKKETEESSKGTKDELKYDKSKKAESSEEKAQGSRKKMLDKKRAGKEQQQESSKKQRMEDDKETNEIEESIWNNGTLSIDKSRWKFQEIFFYDQDALGN